MDPELYRVCEARVPRVRWETGEAPDTCKGPDPLCAAAKTRESHLQQDDRQELIPKVVIRHVLWQAYVCMYTQTQTDDRHTMCTYITHIHSERNLKKVQGPHTAMPCLGLHRVCQSFSQLPHSAQHPPLDALLPGDKLF